MNNIHLIKYKVTPLRGVGYNLTSFSNKVKVLRTSFYLTKLLLTLLAIMCSVNILFAKNKYILPGTIKINDTLFMDKTEVDNISWREYICWNKIIFGEKYAASIGFIDNNLWIEQTKQLEDDSTYLNYSKYYSNHPQFNYYPVVGVSLQQAEAYCKWRSDRVYEMQLIKNKIIPVNNKQDSSNYFTIERFISGKYKTKINNLDKLTKIPIPEYNIPTYSDFLFIYENAYEVFTKEKSEYLKKKSSKILSIIEYLDIATRKKHPNQFGLYNLYGGVSELTSLEGFAFGKNWSGIGINSGGDNIEMFLYDNPNIFVGFRCKGKFIDYKSYSKELLDNTNENNK